MPQLSPIVANGNGPWVPLTARKTWFGAMGSLGGGTGKLQYFPSTFDGITNDANWFDIPEATFTTLPYMGVIWLPLGTLRLVVTGATAAVNIQYSFDPYPS